MVLSRPFSAKKSFLKEIDSMTSISESYLGIYNVRDGQIPEEQIKDPVDAIATIKKVLASSDLPFP